MKLQCNFHYMKELFNDNGIHIYEYCVHRYGFLKEHSLILYMVCKANKDGFAADKDIKRGFYTFKQALNYAIDTYKWPESCPEVAPELPQVCQNCKWLLQGAKKCQRTGSKLIGDPACICSGLYESEE